MRRCGCGCSGSTRSGSSRSATAEEGGSAAPSRSRWSSRWPRATSLLVHAGTAIARAGERGGGMTMKYMDEFRDAELGPALAGKILGAVEPGRHYKVMEVCGGHTHSIYKYGIDDLLPENVELVHGPGCPVCVIPMGRVDDGIAMATENDIIFTCFGDMMRVPGSEKTLTDAKADGRRHPDGLLAARRAAAREAEPGSRGRLLRDRLRDHRALDGSDPEAGQGRGGHQLLLHVQPRHDRAAAAGAARFARPAPRRLHRPGPRLDRRRLPGPSSSSPRTTASRSSSRASSRSTSCTRSG